MMKCNGGCNRMFQEYYRMPDGKVYCYDCWRRGFENAERTKESVRMRLDQLFKERERIRQEKEQAEEQIRSLWNKINYEKSQAGEHASYFDNVDNYRDSSCIPFNYSRVKSMEQDLETLRRRKETLDCDLRRFQAPPTLPNSSETPNYFKSAKWTASGNDTTFEVKSQPLTKTPRIEKVHQSINAENGKNLQEVEHATQYSSNQNHQVSEDKIKETFPEVAVYKSTVSDSLFAGRNLPMFVRDYILRRFSDKDGKIDKNALSNYFDEKMGVEGQILKNRLFSSRERVNVTSRVVFRTELDKGTVWFDLPDAGITKDARVSPQLIQEQPEWFCDGEHWGNMTMRYIEPQGKEKGHILMTYFKPFEPYSVNLDYYFEARCKFDTSEWIDTLVKIMGYNPESFESVDVKMELISRLLPFVEPRLNIIELGPKGTGKSYLYNNFSKRGWIVSGGKITRAKLFFNKQNRQFGLLKHYDTLAIDEIASFSFENPAEMQSIFKSYLEDGRATVDNTVFQSDCGLTLMGNIPVDGETRQPLDSAYYKVLPTMLQESATLDRFHGFIEGWRLPRLESSTILNGWTLDAEYFSNILHQLRTHTEYASIFDELIEESSSDIRDRKAVKRLATAYHKLLFPQIRNLNELSDTALERFKEVYKKYCLVPAITSRGIIRKQCHAIDNEFSSEMPNFNLK